MAFPGDGTWDAEAPMDQLMAWRVWGPLVAAMDPTLREQLRQRLGLPTPERLAESLRTIDEPACGRRWAMDATIFAPSGDVNYDADWYNGLTLSGLARAATCDDPEIAAAAGALSRAVRPQRDLLTAYYEIYHDWRFCSAWTDAQGTLWNIDCAQNGLEGLLGEMRLRRLDDDTDGQEWIRYLAATSAAGIFASLYLPEWLAQSKLTFGDVETLPDTWGLRGTYPHLRAGWADPFTKNPYPLPRYLPEYSALIRLHGPVDRLRDLARKWERDYPHRYEDWQRFYFQPRPDEADLMRSRTISDDPPGTVPCEVGDWAAALHHVFPEIALRMWVFDEDPDEVEARYVRPPALAEQLVLRGGYVLRRDAQPAG
jgi:hypothetical protein